MAARTVLLDSGFLVALVNVADPDHRPCVDVWRELRAQIVTVEGVLVEASHLLRKTRDGQEAAIGLVTDAGTILVAASDDRLRVAAALMRRYRSVPMDLVDALLVATAEALQADEVLTLDVRGFSAYRIGRLRSFRILPTPTRDS